MQSYPISNKTECREVVVGDMGALFYSICYNKVCESLANFILFMRII